jgi:tetratricopeptide (TPR) repeat protein
MKTVRLALLAASAALWMTSAPAGASSGASRAVSWSPLLQEALEAYLDESYEQSIQLFQRVLQRDRRNETALQGLKSAQRKRKLVIENARRREAPALKSARWLLDREDWVEAADRLRGVLRRVPHHPEALSLSRKLSARVAKQQTRAKPKTSEWFYLQGVSDYLKGNWLPAAEVWEQVYAFDPDRVALAAYAVQARRNQVEQDRDERMNALSGEAWASLRNGEYETAVSAWEKLLALDPGNAVAREGIAQAREAARESRSRRRDEEAKALTRQAMDAYIEKEYRKSMKLWEMVLEIDPENTLARDYRSRIRLRDRRADAYVYAPSGDGAVVLAPESYLTNPYSGASDESRYEKAMRFAREERYTEAIEYLERHVESNPSDGRAAAALEDIRKKRIHIAEGFYNRGLESYAQGDAPGAIRLWQDTLKVNPDYQKARQALIKALAENRKRAS